MTNEIIPEGMIPVEEFSSIRGEKPEKTIGMIRYGAYMGRKVNNSWFIDASHLDDDKRKTDKPATQQNNENIPDETERGDNALNKKTMAITALLIISVGAAVTAFNIFFPSAPSFLSEPASSSIADAGRIGSIAGLIVGSTVMFRIHPILGAASLIGGFAYLF